MHSESEDMLKQILCLPFKKVNEWLNLVGLCEEPVGGVGLRLDSFCKFVLRNLI